MIIITKPSIITNPSVLIKPPSIISKPSSVIKIPSGIIKTPSGITKAPSSIIKPPSVKTPPPGSPALSIYAPPSIKSSKVIIPIRKAPPVITAFILTEDKTQKTIGKDKKPFNFIGYTHQTKVMGHRTSRTDITVGDWKTAKIEFKSFLKETEPVKKRKSKRKTLSLGKKGKLRL